MILKLKLIKKINYLIYNVAWIFFAFLDYNITFMIKKIIENLKKKNYEKFH